MAQAGDNIAHTPEDGASRVERSIDVDIPIHDAYEHWTHFEDLPRFMEGVIEVRRTGEDELHWVVEVGGKRHEWDARIHQVEDQNISWKSLDGKENSGSVRFNEISPEWTRVTLELEYQPEGWLEKLGDAVGVVEMQVIHDLERFKRFVEGPELRGDPQSE
jgi:uncharacterized membrane protein